MLGGDGCSQGDQALVGTARFVDSAPVETGLLEKTLEAGGKSRYAAAASRNDDVLEKTRKAFWVRPLDKEFQSLKDVLKQLIAAALDRF